MSATRREERTYLVDARWLGRGGPGRATEFVLRGLSEVDPAGRWIVWGPKSAGSWSWSTSTHVVSDSDPRRAWGQRLGLPRHDAVLFLHQIRPLHARHPVTVIHDTIPLRYTSGARRFQKRQYMRAVAAGSKAIITVSEYSRRCISRDLGVAPDAIEVVRFPIDHDMVARVQALRSSGSLRNFALAVGRDAPHKNLDRLIAAFARGRFRQEGGSLTLAGIQPEAQARLTAVARREGVSVDILGAVTQSQLEELYASTRAVVMASLEEGFGLPAWEAMSCGLPVALAEAGSLPEIGGEHACYFSPTSVEDIANAIDRAVIKEKFDGPMPEAPSLGQFASTFVAKLAEEPG